MKNSIVSLSFAGWITLSIMTGCVGAKKEKITDIPVTSQSKEAIESFRSGLIASCLLYTSDAADE